MLSTAAPTIAQTDPVDSAVKVITSRADRELALLDQQERALHKATVSYITFGAMDPPDTSAAVELLSALQKDLPYFRSEYRDHRDYCSTLRELRTQRGYLLDMKLKALHRSIAASRASAMYNGIRVSMEVASLTGKPMSKADVQRVFLADLKDDLTETYNKEMYLPLEGWPKDSCD